MKQFKQDIGLHVEVACGVPALVGTPINRLKLGEKITEDEVSILSQFCKVVEDANNDILAIVSNLKKYPIYQINQDAQGYYAGDRRGKYPISVLGNNLVHFKYWNVPERKQRVIQLVNQRLLQFPAEGKYTFEVYWWARSVVLHEELQKRGINYPIEEPTYNHSENLPFKVDEWCNDIGSLLKSVVDAAISNGLDEKSAEDMVTELLGNCAQQVQNVANGIMQKIGQFVQFKQQRAQMQQPMQNAPQMQMNVHPQQQLIPFENFGIPNEVVQFYLNKNEITQYHNTQLEWLKGEMNQAQQQGASQMQLQNLQNQRMQEIYNNDIVMARRNAYNDYVFLMQNNLQQAAEMHPFYVNGQAPMQQQSMQMMGTVPNAPQMQMNVPPQQTNYVTEAQMRGNYQFQYQPKEQNTSGSDPIKELMDKINKRGKVTIPTGVDDPNLIQNMMGVMCDPRYNYQVNQQPQYQNGYANANYIKMYRGE